ncbi:cell division protein FtsX [Moheibacter sediminis]|uniref:Cell division protein FtsX n=1 Tax=Moheibacter sediminis TaxID=1434700 RepID=A0A1W2B0B2_9FLAO|nr:permease-like cell division protein FtsX [Moheibacter sediminis]SMC66403.1 cell division transport system permease protein [Moheibacter sediminis]
MSKSSDKFNQGRLRSSNITVVISIALVLFLLGLFGLIVINAQSYAAYIKEQLKLEAFFNDEYDPREQDTELARQQTFIDSLKIKHVFVKSTEYISKDKASEIAKQELGIDDNAIFEANIFPASVQITLNPDYVNPKQVDSIKQIISANPIVNEVVNDDELMTTVYNNIDRITFWLMVLAAIFLVIVMVLINNSIRLRIYAKRFSIKTMQLVGARRRFIIQPFLVQSAVLGFFGALIAVLALGGLWYYFSSMVLLPFWNDDYYLLIGAIFIVGIVIALISTGISTWRYLRLRTDQLY